MVTPGPVGEYVEVIDYDPSSKCFYRPVDLSDSFILAQDGLDPSESNPQFHQQMVYAVAMTTIRNFELALGRKIMWSSHRDMDEKKDNFVPRLRIYPHALREANAYYSPQKKALLFGYFSAVPDTPSLLMPGGTVYTCLSHDIIAHEITHALLDGMHRRYVEATHIDSLAFHEAFADLVALFQHFTFPEVLRSQIAKTQGDLAIQNLLGELAQEFGKAIGHYGSLRDAIGRINNKTKKWEPLKPDPQDYTKIREPHGRGSILVATIFDAFISIYKSRITDLKRIASNGTGILAQGSLHPDLVNRMTTEASKSARHVLNMSIRALDYCPPMDINFGDYLRALITADYDLIAEDTMDYRIALIEAFQRRGIFPAGVKNMSVESLLFKSENGSERFEKQFASLIEFFKKFKEKVSYINNREDLFELTKIFIGGGDLATIERNKLPERERRKIKKDETKGLHAHLYYKFMGEKESSEFSKLTTLILSNKYCEQMGIEVSKNEGTLGMPKVEVHNLRLVSRVGPQGNVINQILVTLTQRRGVVCEEDENGNVEVMGFFPPTTGEKGWYYKKIGKKFKKVKYAGRKLGLTGEGSEKVLPEGWFIFRGGCTLIFDLDYESSRDNIKPKYAICKDINSEERMIEQYKMLYGDNDDSLNATYFGSAYGNLEAEPFALIHKVL